MKNLNNWGLLVLLIILGFACNNNESKTPTKENLFQENNKNWITTGEAQWTFNNGEIIGEANEGIGYMITQDAYENFILELEFMPDSTINSGVFIRCDSEELGASNCYEINIWDLHPNQDYRTGSVVTRVKPLEKVETLNQWNKYKIQSKDDHLQVWINDIKTVDFHDDQLKNGLVGLQAGGNGVIKFKNVTLEVLE